MNGLPKLILPLDVPLSEVNPILQELSSMIPCFMVGLNYIASGNLVEVARRLKEVKVDLFLDGKFHDIPSTMAEATQSAVQLGPRMFTIHASGGREMMKVVKEIADERAGYLNLEFVPMAVAVTVLTTMDVETWRLLFKTRVKVETQVLHFVDEALAAGLKAVVASPLEVEAIRKRFGSELNIITPGIRPAWAVEGDQKRFATPREALEMGASSLVIGRPILSPPPDIGSRRRAVEMIAAEIGGLM
jgi:orotidine-5'-phosphate decarboxylase